MAKAQSLFEAVRDFLGPIVAGRADAQKHKDRAKWLEAALGRRDALLRECLNRVVPGGSNLQARIIAEINDEPQPEREAS